MLRLFTNFLMNTKLINSIAIKKAYLLINESKKYFSQFI
jgi:hypothetical protein